MDNETISPKWKNRIEALLVTIAIQGFFAFLFFVGTLLDPLIGVWMVAVYFLLVASLAIYFCQLHKIKSKRAALS